MTLMPFRDVALRLSAVAVALAAGALPVRAAAPELAMLSTLERGGWDVKVRGEDSRSRLCLRQGTELIQIRHRQTACSRTVIEDGANAVVVSYSCPGNGYGRTTIRRESTRLVQIETQGIENGLPFHFAAEARHAGGC